MFAKVDRTTAMGKPSHDELVRSDQLLAVDAEVLARLARPASYRQSPRNERSCVVGPTRLDRKARKVHVLSLPHHLLARSARNFLRGHVHHLSSDRNPALEHVAKSLGRFRFPEEREQLSDVAQRLAWIRAYFCAHGEGNAARRAEQVAQHWDHMAHGLFEQQSRATRLEHAVADFGHFEPRIDLGAHPLQLARAFELRQKITQVPICHLSRRSLLRRRRPARFTSKGFPASSRSRQKF